MQRYKVVFWIYSTVILLAILSSIFLHSRENERMRELERLNRRIEMMESRIEKGNKELKAEIRNLIYQIQALKNQLARRSSYSILD